MTSLAPEDRLPSAVEGALRRVLRLLPSASAEIRAFGSVTPTLGNETVYTAAVENVSHWLYAAWYCAGEAEEAISPVPLGRENLGSALRASVAASTRWQTGWIVMHCAQNGKCVAGYQNQTREFQPGEYINRARPGIPVVPGDAITVRELIDWVDELTGFWYAQSFLGTPANPWVRLYWSVAVHHISFVLHALTAALDALGVRYLLKCPSHAAGYSRVDSLVVYVEKESWPLMTATMEKTAREVAQYLRHQSPPFTLALAPGLAFAEDPGTQKSFGESRCQALAPGVLSVWRNGSISPEAALLVLVDALRTAGVDPAQPWLSTVRYEQN